MFYVKYGLFSTELSEKFADDSATSQVANLKNPAGASDLISLASYLSK